MARSTISMLTFIVERRVRWQKDSFVASPNRESGAGTVR
jgi:hypothetical protein